MSMKVTWLPDKPSVRQMSLTRASENTTLPAPMIVTFTDLGTVSSLQISDCDATTLRSWN